MSDETICVYGLWHLGCVTAACLAAAGYRVIGLDPDPDRVAALATGTPPIAEPGLAALIEAGLATQRLCFTDDPSMALADASLLWVTFDTPVDDEDRADSTWVRRQIDAVHAWVAPDSLVLVSSQVPVGFTRVLESDWQIDRPDVTFACSPENLRLGKAIEVFQAPGRVVVGLGRGANRDRIAELLAPFCGAVEWMTLESAEMTKHALNSYLAVSVVFTNELARLCERVGADALEVERGLRSDSRIGKGAYVSPGLAIAGGTLARDVRFLASLADTHDIALPVIQAIQASNALHAEWPHERVVDLVRDVPSPRVALLGLTYKPGTDTLRRSSAVELGQALARRGMTVTAFDPAVIALPPEINGLHLARTAEESLVGADVAVVATTWPAFRDLTSAQLKRVMRHARVVDPSGFLSHLAADDGLSYVRVGVDRRAPGC